MATRVKTVNRNLNRRLEIVAEKLGIDKKLSMHIARHSFGNISGDKIPIQMLQKLYRHSSITTTVSYQSNFMYKETDDALEKVVDF
ncbi:tyrosine-type recombinase/integrase [Maribacter sp. ACAM166]|uniref:tyrosine-type recombinase/integrase n=1 Tax=Maribacter sp. ACAM166 TaxID=2508996 RepID=UPI002017A3AB|nr:tyrosine-type recombinase/integrase [Maribacter sp. ACAM166]